MNIKKILKNMLTDTSIFFTVITALYAALMMVVNVETEEPAIRASWLLYIFIFSVLGAISQCILRIDSWNKALRVAIQYVILIFGSYVCFFLPLSLSGSQIMIGFAAVTVLYFLIYGVCAFLSWSFKRNSKKEEVYESKFKKLR
ncbi:MAG: hypothetical protein IJ011_09860 [Clostridia bacterium]|nr:hypothetical protein [Clostridia bacterium]